MTRRDIYHSQRRARPDAPARTARPGFLSLPNRAPKPRRTGISHVLDTGLSLREVQDRLDAASESIDVWKLGWGTAYLDPALDAKLALLAEHDVMACPGGTLLEIAWHQGVVDEFLDWVQTVGFPAVEVSCGSVSMTRAAKDSLIRTAAGRFTVLAEVGRKDPSAPVSAGEWARDAAADVAAGARWVVTEGRESGTVGLFTSDGRVRSDLVDAIVASVGEDAVLFEAPQRAQQAWLIRHLGPDVNLGNINARDALSVEALRLGLRSDTIETALAARPLAPQAQLREARP